MIKVTVSYKNDTAKYNEEDSFLIDTYNHPIAMLTAMEAFNRKHDGNISVQYISTRNDEDVLAPSTTATQAVRAIY